MRGTITRLFARLVPIAVAVLSMHGTPNLRAAPAAATTPAGTPLLYDLDYGRTRLGAIPAGWRDLIDDRASASWGVDALGFLRTVVKNYEGLIVYEGALADETDASKLADGAAEVTFRKTIDETVCVTVVGRLLDATNYYAARVRGFNKVELIKVKDGEVVKLVDFVTRENLVASNLWRLRLDMRGDHLTARVLDEGGVEQARIDALDTEFKLGRVGLRATEYAAAQSFRIMPAEAFKAVLSSDEIAARNEVTGARGVAATMVVKPAGDVAAMNTPFDRLADGYDVIVAGAGTGGSAAAVQATRLGSTSSAHCSTRVPRSSRAGTWTCGGARPRGGTRNSSPFTASSTGPRRSTGGMGRFGRNGRGDPTSPSPNPTYARRSPDLPAPPPRRRRPPPSRRADRALRSRARNSHACFRKPMRSGGRRSRRVRWRTTSASRAASSRPFVFRSLPCRNSERMR